MNELGWLTVDEDEEVVWTGNPKLQTLLSIRFTDYVVTDKALYMKTGIFSRSVKKIDLDKVQNISFSQGVLAKTFGYGTIEISTAGGSGVEMRFRAIESPREVQEKINTRIGSEPKGEVTEKQLLKQILSEVREINDKL